MGAAMSKIGAIGRFLAVGVAALCAGALQAETLAEALGKAYQSNPQLEAQRARERASDEVVAQARGAFGPQVNASASYQFLDRRTTGTLGSRDDGAGFTYGVTLDQPLFTSGQLAASLNAAQAAQLVEREALRLAEQGLIAEVVAAYVGVQRDLAIYGVQSQIRQLLDDQFDITSERFRLRDVTATDLDQTDNRRLVARAREEEALANVQSSATAYRRLVGNFPQDLAPLPGLPVLPDLQSLYQIAETRSPQILIAHYAAQTSRETLAQRRAERGPVVTGNLAALASPLSPFENKPRAEELMAGVSVVLPLYSGGVLSARIREAEQLSQADVFDHEQARRDVRDVIGARWNQARAARAATPVYRSSVEAARSALVGVRRQEQVGTRTSRDVLETTNDLLNSRIAEIDSAANGYIATVYAMANAGLLDIAQFGADAPRYDPEGYDPFAQGLAGLPLQPLLDPIDSILLDRSTEDVTVLREADPAYTVPSAAADAEVAIPAPEIEGEAPAAPLPPPPSRGAGALPD